MTVAELVRALRGPTELAKEIGITQSGVSQWVVRGEIPREHHLTVWRLALAAGLDWRPPGTDGLSLHAGDHPAPRSTVEAA